MVGEHIFYYPYTPKTKFLKKGLGSLFQTVKQMFSENKYCLLVENKYFCTTKLYFCIEFITKNKKHLRNYQTHRHIFSYSVVFNTALLHHCYAITIRHLYKFGVYASISYLCEQNVSLRQTSTLSIHTFYL